MFEIALVSLASFVAGCVDAIVGGGGLILVPALFLSFAAASPPALLGTNKVAAIAGTSVSAWRFAQKIDLEWRVLGPGLVVAFVGSLLGAWALTAIDPTSLRKSLPIALGVLLVYTLAKKDFGTVHNPLSSTKSKVIVVGLIALATGFYDGIFGPGTGSFMIFLLVRFLGVDFLNASAMSKVLNVATNAAAIGLLSFHGHVWWKLGLLLAGANVLGSLVGAKLALKHGPALVKKVFVIVVAVLIYKTASNAYF